MSPKSSPQERGQSGQNQATKKQVKPTEVVLFLNAESLTRIAGRKRRNSVEKVAKPRVQKPREAKAAKKQKPDSFYG
jgi:hypothetical protein